MIAAPQRQMKELISCDNYNNYNNDDDDDHSDDD
jgi:hypothetical protein